MRGTCSWSALLLQISETSFLHWLPPQPLTAKLPPCSTAPCMAHTMHNSLITTSPHRCSVTVHSMLSIFLVTANVRLVRPYTGAVSQLIPYSDQCSVPGHTNAFDRAHIMLIPVQCQSPYHALTRPISQPLSCSYHPGMSLIQATDISCSMPESCRYISIYQGLHIRPYQPP